MSLPKEHKNLATEEKNVGVFDFVPHFVRDMLREPKDFSVASMSPWCRVISNKVY